jgi:hypothetical protein
VWNLPEDDRITSIKTRYIDDKTFLLISIIFHTQHGSSFIIGRRNPLSKEVESKIKQSEWHLGKNDNLLGFKSTRKKTQRQEKITSLGFIYDKCAPEIIRKAKNKLPVIIHNPDTERAYSEV